MSASACINLYKGEIPFAIWLKNYFREHKKFGSRDRKTVAHLCYCFFRLGAAFQNLSVEERIQTGLFLTSEKSNLLLEGLNPDWNRNAHLSINEKFSILNAPDEWKEIFPLHQFVSTEIETKDFIKAHLVQPDVHIRLRPGHENIVKEKLTTAEINYSELSEQTIALPATTKLEEILALDVEAVVQDWSSQRVAEGLKNLGFVKKEIFTAWDCCAASGGKSILINDLFPNVQLTVSDVRSSILQNLHSRFAKAGIKNYTAFVADVARGQFNIGKTFDLVLCDAPCSGSGTWSRAPENVSYFKKEKIEYYVNLQKCIAENASKAGTRGGAFLYSTCSVFEVENESVVEHILATTKLQLQSMNYLKGYHQKGDTLFAALFTL